MKRNTNAVKKHLLPSFAALMLGLSSFATFANPAPADGPVVTRTSYRAAVFPTTAQPDQIFVAVERLVGEPMTVTLRDAAGQVVGQKKIGSKLEKFRFRFVLIDAPDGAYTVEISTPRDQSRHAFTLATQPGIRNIKIS